VTQLAEKVKRGGTPSKIAGLAVTRLQTGYVSVPPDEVHSSQKLETDSPIPVSGHDSKGKPRQKKRSRDRK